MQRLAVASSSVRAAAVPTWTSCAPLATAAVPLKGNSSYCRRDAKGQLRLTNADDDDSPVRRCCSSAVAAAARRSFSSSSAAAAAAAAAPSVESAASSASDVSGVGEQSHATSTPSADAETTTTTTLDGRRKQIVHRALDMVHEYGWTSDAIAAAVVELGHPPATVGLVLDDPDDHPDLASHFMDVCNEKLRSDLSTRRIEVWEKERYTTRERIEDALRLRLEMVLPYVESHRWHEGMALGASNPLRAVLTAGQLNDMAGIVLDAAVGGSRGQGGGGGVSERAAIVAVYAAVELHLLDDDSPEKRDTWSFLKERVNDLETLANTSYSPSSLPLSLPPLPPLPSWNGVVGGGDSAAFVTAATAVASSLAGGAISVAMPAVRVAAGSAASHVLPHVMTFMQPPAATDWRQRHQPSSSSDGTMARRGDGTCPSDYVVQDDDAELLKDLPPFEAEGGEFKKG